MTLSSLVAGDLSNLRRDPMLTAAASAPLLIVALLRFGLPHATEALGEVMDLEAGRPVVLGAATLLAPLLAGFVFGFILVEEKEERILDAVAVTTRGTAWFLAYRTLLPAAVGGVGALVVAIASGVVPLEPAQLAVTSLLSSASAGSITLLVAVIARDRVQALAVGKLTSFVVVAAVAYQLLPDPWRWPMALFPSTWVVEAVTTGGSPWWPLLWGAVAHGGVGGLLWRSIRR